MCRNDTTVTRYFVIYCNDIFHWYGNSHRERVYKGTGKTRGLKGDRFCDNRTNCGREWVLRGKERETKGLIGRKGQKEKRKRNLRGNGGKKAGDKGEQRRIMFSKL